MNSLLNRAVDPEIAGAGESEGMVSASSRDRFYAVIVRRLTGFLIVVLCLWMLAGVADLLWELYRAWTGTWRASAERVIVNVLIILALLEILRTLQAYLELGRIRVTFIIDTALVVLVGELIGLWFNEYLPLKVLLSLAVIGTLVALRIVTANHSKLGL
jgi:uncharacterized membrane protein (DUF373 family)